jgi:DMSO/TMAO reductase YedYZ molybdopterin-dependent catalytic subunit
MRRIPFSRSGFLPGVVAALIASVAILVLGRIWSAPVPPQLLADRITSITPVDVFGAILGKLESSAKPLIFVLLLIGQIVLGGLVGGLLAGLLKRGNTPLKLFLVTSLVSFGLLGLVFSPLGDIGLFGRNSSVGSTTTIISFAIISLVFSGVVTAWLAAMNSDFAVEYDESRRRVVGFVAVGVPILLASAYIGKFFVALNKKSQVPAAPDTPDGISPALTSVDDFYVVSKNFIDPTVSQSSWKLSIEGLVEHPRSYTYNEIRSHPATKHIATLECISNEVGGEYISNGEWTGFPLKQLLDDAGVKPGVVKVVFYGDDGYSDSIPLAAAMDPNTFLVHELDGAPLPQEHGFPARMLVPNIYGMKNVKWLTKIALVDNDFKGFWQHRGWSDVAVVNTMSRIDYPEWLDTVTAGQPVKVGGVAFAGNRGISKVELSLDGGKTWNAASQQKPLSPLSWVIWTYQWTPQEAGKVSLVVRATDGTGQTQTSEENPPLPDGATGYDLVQVKIAAASG